MKFIKGYAYLARVGDTTRKWYLIQQSGMKSWEALLFSHISLNHEETFFHGNSETLYEKLATEHKKNGGEDRVIEVWKFNHNKDMRRAMFDILKTGRIEL